MNIHNDPLLTRIYEQCVDFQPLPESVYVGLQGIEERSHHFQTLTRANAVKFVTVIREGENDFDARSDDGPLMTFGLRSRRRLQDFWKQYPGKTIYLDITGLRHHIWIPLLRAALADATQSLKVIYVEPDKYNATLAPTGDRIYDLSEHTQGVAPIPGFASFSRVGDEFLFLPLLGFEGTRVARLLEKIQPIDDMIIPVVGLPGFRPEHPFYTYAGNRQALEETNAWQRVEFADANCPFSLYYLLERINAQHEQQYLKIALIGTKPHALGAVLFALRDLSMRELIYDHPIRRSMRTSGTGRLLEYDISAFSTTTNA